MLTTRRVLTFIGRTPRAGSTGLGTCPPLHRRTALLIGRSRAIPQEKTDGAPSAMRTTPRSGGTSGAGDEPHAALVGLRDLHVGDPVDGDDDAPSPLVDQRQQAVLAAAGHGRRHFCGDLFRGLGTVDDQLPGGVLNTDLDFHVGDASSVRATGPNASPGVPAGT